MVREIRSRADLGASIVLVGVGALIISQSRGLIRGDDPLGPSFFPMLIGAALVGLALLLGLRSLRAPHGEIAADDAYDRAGVARVAAATIAMMALVFGLAYVPEISFPILSLIMVFVLSVLFGGYPGPRTLAFAALLSVAVYVVFRIWFKLPLPGPVWI